MTQFLPGGQEQIVSLTRRMDVRSGLEATSLEEGELVVSLDVKSVYIKVPVEEEN